MVAAATARAADPPGSETVLRRPTVAGDLTITRLGDDVAGGPFRIALGDRIVMQTDNDKPAPGMPIPMVVDGFRGLAPFDEVVVLQQNTLGNACNGGPLWVLGLRRDAPPAVSGMLDFCGGASPVIRREGNRLSITFPGGPPNRASGSLPTARWIYESGRFRPAM